jgi:hypothetical protein
MRGKWYIQRLINLLGGGGGKEISAKGCLLVGNTKFNQENNEWVCLRIIMYNFTCVFLQILCVIKHITTDNRKIL